MRAPSSLATIEAKRALLLTAAPLIMLPAASQYRARWWARPSDGLTMHAILRRLNNLKRREGDPRVTKQSAVAL